MKHPVRSGSKLLSSILSISLWASASQATVSYWDPEGFKGNYLTYSGGSLSGTWENSSWARNSSPPGTNGPPADKGVFTPAAFTEGDAAVFAVGAGATNNLNGGLTNTTAFTITMNANHTIAGIFDGTLNPKPGIVTINGSGILTLTNDLDAFSVGTNSPSWNDASLGVLTVNVPITGLGTLAAEGGGGQIFLNASNSYTGGTQIGATNAGFTGILNFTNSTALGTGPIVISSGSSGAFGTLQCTNGGVTVTNAVDFSQALSAAPFLNIVGNAAGVTFSGPWTCGTNAANLGAGGAANLVTISGAISGTAGFGKFNPGTLLLLGANTYNGGTTISAGTLQIGNGGALGSLGSGSIVDNGTLVFNRSGTVTVGDGISGLGTLTQAGSGTLLLNAANSYSGITTVSAGTLQLGDANSIPSVSAVKVLSGAVLDCNGFGPTMSYLIGPGNVINNNGTLTVSGNLTTLGNNNTYSCVSGAIGGSGNLTKSGSHAMALRGANSFSGGLVQLEAGTLSIGAAPNRLPTGSTLLTFGGGLFQLDANNQTVAALSGSGNVNLGGGTLTVNQSAGTTFSGVIQNSELAGSSTASGNGLRGYYYDNIDFTNLKAVRDDASVNFPALTSGTNSSAMPSGGIATNTFSVRWLGQVLSTTAGSYTFTTVCDDGSRLWVNSTLVVDNWVDQGAIAKSGTITLAGGTLYDIVLEYYNNGGPGAAVLSWIPPGGVSNAIPSANLLLPGPGALVKTGGGALNLSGVNTYTGRTFVGGGTLEISSANGLASPSVTVTNGATLKLDSNTALNPQALLILNTNSGSPGLVNLNYAGTAQLGTLSLDGGTTFAASGTWGAVGSGASHTSSRFTGAGVLNISVCSSTNSIVGITNNGNSTFTLKMQGTFGAGYYLVSQTNISQPLANWQVVPGSTNTVSAGNGIWTFTATNRAPAYFRVKALNSCF